MINKTYQVQTAHLNDALFLVLWEWGGGGSIGVLCAAYAAFDLPPFR
jgi:hypothetical protein